MKENTTTAKAATDKKRQDKLVAPRGETNKAQLVYSSRLKRYAELRWSSDTSLSLEG